MRKKKSNNRVLYILSGICAIAIIGLIIGKKAGVIGKNKGLEVEIAEVKRETIVEKVSASGMIQPEVEVKISPEVPGEIIELNVEEGDSVSATQLLVKIRPDNFENALERAIASLNQQQANRAEARAREARASASYERAKLDFDRQKKLYDQKVISEADFQTAEANYKIAQEDLKSAQQSALAANYMVKSSKANVADARENLDLTTIRAPMSGIVSKLNVEQGERVVGTSQMQGTELLRIADLGQMEVRVNVNENDIIRISEGDTAIIDVDSYSYMDKTFKGLVTQIANTANNKTSPDAVTEFEVRIRIINSSYRDLVQDKGMSYPFRPGMTASVDILTQTKKDIATVPLAAVTTRKPQEEEEKSKKEEKNGDEVIEVVFVMEEGIAKMKEVQTGISDFENIEILEGLKEGDKVISGPFLAVSKRLKEGEAVFEKGDKGRRKTGD